MIYSLDYASPLGLIKIQGTNEHILSLEYLTKPSTFPHEKTKILSECTQQLDEYFAGKRRAFTIPYKLYGTPFQKSVRGALLDIPYGKTTTYGEQAKRLGDEKAVRAVGRCNGQNPLPILIPCHRVIAKSGELQGYRGGLEKKLRLLALEQKQSFFEM